MKTALYLLPLALVLVGCSDDEPATTATTDSGDFGDGPITVRPDDGVDTGTPVTDTGTAMDTSTGETAGETGAETGTETGTETGADAGVTTVTVTTDSKFSPASVTIKAGQTVKWVWAGSGHNVVSGTACTADNKFCSPSNSGCAMTPTSSAGATYERTFPTAGTFPYFCQPHCPGMAGTVIVTP